MMHYTNGNYEAFVNADKPADIEKKNRHISLEQVWLD